MEGPRVFFHGLTLVAVAIMHRPMTEGHQYLPSTQRGSDRTGVTSPLPGYTIDTAAHRPSQQPFAHGLGAVALALRIPPLTNRRKTHFRSLRGGQLSLALWRDGDVFGQWPAGEERVRSFSSFSHTAPLAGGMADKLERYT